MLVCKDCQTNEIFRFWVASRVGLCNVSRAVSVIYSLELNKAEIKGMLLAEGNDMKMLMQVCDSRQKQ